MSLCECGCGMLAPIAKKTFASRGWVRGQPLRFVQGHSGRVRPKGAVRYEIDEKTGCWIWQRSLMPNGYGHLTVNNRQVPAHRFVYEMLVGPIPKGADLDHLCRNKPCVNPHHLEPVPHAENSRRGNSAKLTHPAARQIRELRQGGASIKHLTNRFAISRRAVGAVLRGESWN